MNRLTISTTFKNLCHAQFVQLCNISGRLANLESLKEPCILVDENDNVLGTATKEKCHLFQLPNPHGLLHRAFSVLLFNDSNELLLQQRSQYKLLFAEYWSNSCCSHPLYASNELTSDGILGVKIAAQRRLKQELGIKECPIEDLFFLTRIRYCFSYSNSLWGENELDYILILKKNVQLTLNPDEINNVCYINKNDMPKFLKEQKVTPWLLLLWKHFLPNWWDYINELTSLKESHKIHSYLPTVIN